MSNPFSAMLATLEPDRFVGRVAEIESILRGISAGEPRSYALVGPKTIGTTSLLKHLSTAVHEDRYQSALIDYGRFTDSSDSLRFLYVDFYSRGGDEVLAILLSELKEWMRRCGDVNAGASHEAEGRASVRSELQSILRALADDRRRIVICMDHFDQAFGSMSVDDDVFLRNLTLTQSFIIATASSLGGLREDRKRISPFFNVLLERDLGLLSKSEARALLTGATDRLNVPLLDSEVEFVLLLAGRHPYLLTLVGEHYLNLRNRYPEIADAVTEQTTRAQIELQIGSRPNVADLFHFYWELLQEVEMSALLSIAQGESASFDAYKGAMASLRQKALIELEFGQTQPRIFSKLFRDFVAATAGAGLVVAGLSPLDGRLFQYLRDRPNEICTFAELQSKFWDGSDPKNKRGLEAAIHRIRMRIQQMVDPEWDYIQNVRGVGYRYVPKYGE